MQSACPQHAILVPACGPNGRASRPCAAQAPRRGAVHGMRCSRSTESISDRAPPIELAQPHSAAATAGEDACRALAPAGEDACACIRRMHAKLTCMHASTVRCMHASGCRAHAPPGSTRRGLPQRRRSERPHCPPWPAHAPRAGSSPTKSHSSCSTRQQR